MKVIKSVCQMCGPGYAGCGIDVHVSDGKVIKIEGTKGHPVNDGKLCAKGLAAIQMEYDPGRLQYPLKRAGARGEGKWQRVSWDEAMATIVTRLKAIIAADGARAITWFKGQGSAWESNWSYAQRFMNALGSPNSVTQGHNCEIPRAIACRYTYGSIAWPDYENTRCVVLWGYNPLNTSLPNNGARVMRAKQRGAKLIVIDPRFTRTAAKADIFVQLRPGSDGALALGMLNVIIEENRYDKEFVDKWTGGFDKLSELVKQYPPEKVAEITWVPAEMIREIARIYATTKPAVLQDGNGLDQQPTVIQTLRALCILRVITGNLDVPGGNVFNPEAPPFFSRTAPMTMRDMSKEGWQRSFQGSVSTHPLFYGTSVVTLPEAIEAILTEKPYPIRAVILHSINPVV
ncbi:MAG: molybdopterin-dependent oxidoreductase, partial [Chloroflexota bacterium]